MFLINCIVRRVPRTSNGQGEHLIPTGELKNGFDTDLYRPVPDLRVNDAERPED